MTGRSPRWAFLEGLDIGADDDPYLDRLRIIQTPLFGVYLHRIHRPDLERDGHDHPWWFARVILFGGYTERIWPDKRDPSRSWLRRGHRWSFGVMPRRAAHVITEITGGPLWTLVLTGPRRSSWGFWPGGQFVPWREYQYAAPQPARAPAPHRGSTGEL